MDNNALDKARGAMLGHALGDALGAQTEFLSVAAILSRWPPAGPQEPASDDGGSFIVTDDTQMALHIGEALAAALNEPRFTPTVVEEQLRRELLNWLEDPTMPNRAPGNTCLRGCRALEKGLPWSEASVTESKGCGANMRVGPVALLGLRGLNVETLSGVSQLQAAMTHGHPVALVAADLTQHAALALLLGLPPAELLPTLRAYAEKERASYREDWLGELWKKAGFASPAAYIHEGWETCAVSLDRVEAAIRRGDRESDPCLSTGAGWIAEEALATGLLCFLLFADEPTAALRRAAVTSGDSDSIASLTGLFAGAHLGASAFPESWLHRVEYRSRLENMVQALLTPATR